MTKECIVEIGLSRKYILRLDVTKESRLRLHCVTMECIVDWLVKEICRKVGCNNDKGKYCWNTLDQKKCCIFYWWIRFTWSIYIARKML